MPVDRMDQTNAPDGHRLVLIHPMDPRGIKLGGIETHVRLVASRFPDDWTMLFVGVDESGDLPLGRVAALSIDGRAIDFLPVVHVPAVRINLAATRVRQSTTLRFALGALRHVFEIRRAMRQGPPGRATCEIERFEFALLPKLLGVPSVLVVHNEGTGQDAMDSLLKRYWALHRLNERLALWLADQVFAVNDAIAGRIAAMGSSLAAKTTVMSVSVDTTRFRPTAFPPGTTFRVCFAGRLDAFKDPPLMLATLAALARRLAERPAGRFARLVFDYVGASDPDGIAGFDAIAPFVERHGIATSADVAAIMARAHAGLVTSYFEGMPCYLLEMLATGRPLAAIALPQFAPLVVAGTSGGLIARHDDRAALAEALAAVLYDCASAIADGRLDPMRIATLAQPYSVTQQMGRLFAAHAGLAGGVVPR